MIELPDNFFSEYWQKKPCLIKAGTQWRPEITPDELAGIACEEDARARLIQEFPQEKGAHRWQLDEGPFDENLFSTLPESHWTLVVQEVDSWDEQVAQLLHVPVIPNWRIQDIMVSYAVDKGSVGPHFDHYDVFLVQGLGKRTWKLSEQCTDLPLLPHDDILLLKDMPVTQEFGVEPGDIVYIPPGIGHWGIAEGECMTFSIGFRAPSAAETLQELTDRICPNAAENHRYQDSEAFIQYHQSNQRTHELASESIAQFRRLINETLTDEVISQWLGCRVTATEQRLPLFEEMTQDHFESLWHIGAFEKHPQNRMVWHRKNNSTMLFCNGLDISFETGLKCDEEAQFLEILCNNTFINVNQEPFKSVGATKSIIKWLLEQEALVPASDAESSTEI